MLERLTNLLPIAVAIPLVAAFVLPLLQRRVNGPRTSRCLTLLVATALLLLAALFITLPDTTYWMGNWSPHSGAIGISLVLDGLSRLMFFIVALIAFAATLFSLRYMTRYTAEPLYYCLFCLMVTGMTGVVLSGDLFNLYVFLEIAAIASYALVAFGTGREEIEAAFKYLVLGTVGSAFILLGIAIVYNQTGQLNMALIAQNLPPNSSAVLIAAAFFLMGFGLKAAMVPFHAWLPDAHPSAPAPISAMLSGVLIKALGVYTLVRLFFDCLVMNRQFAYVLIVLGAASMVIGVLLALGQEDFKRLLAYSSISQTGYVVLAAGIAGEMVVRANMAVAALALLGGLFHLFNHAVFKSLLFLCSGATEYSTGTRMLKSLGGLKQRMPLTSSCLRVAALSIAGVPPFSGFWSKLLIIIAIIQAGHLWLGAMTVLVSFITLLTFLKVQRHILDGTPSPAVAQAREVPWSMTTAMILLTTICIAAGLFFPYYKDALFQNTQAILSGPLQLTGPVAAGGSP